MKSKKLYWALALIFAQLPLTAFAEEPAENLVDLNREEAGLIFKNFRVGKATTSNGLELHVQGTLPEACADFFVISNSSNDSQIEQAGALNIRIRDKGTQGRDCIKAESKKGICGGQGKICKSLSELPGGRIALEDKDFSIQFARVNPEGDGEKRLEISALQFSDGKNAEMVSSKSIREVSLALLKKDFENCKNSGRASDYKTALEDLDELYRLGEYDDEGLDTQKELLAKKEYSVLKESVEKLDAALMSGVVDDLESFLERYPERADDVAKLMVAAGIKVAKADPSSESQYQSADEIFERAEGIADISKSVKTQVSYARLASGFEHARPMAQNGSLSRAELLPLVKSLEEKVDGSVRDQYGRVVYRGDFRNSFAALDRSVEHDAKVRRLLDGAAMIKQIYLNAVNSEQQKALKAQQDEMASKRNADLVEAQRRLAEMQQLQTQQTQPNATLLPNDPSVVPNWQSLW